MNTGDEKKKKMITLHSRHQPMVSIEARLQSDRKAILEDLRAGKFTVLQTGANDYLVLGGKDKTRRGNAGQVMSR